MPLYGIPAKDYLDREDELAYLKRLASLRRDTLADNVLLIGPRGIGKTEFLKQLYRSLFWDSQDVVPFYYSFKTAALKSTTFARDYFARFVKQYVAFVKKEPLHVNNMSMPLPRLIPLISNLGLDWLIDCIDDFQQNTDQGDLYGQLLSAISLLSTQQCGEACPFLSCSMILLLRKNSMRPNAVMRRVLPAFSRNQ